MEIKISVPLILIGLLAHIDFSQSRAVNVSNTWTLPRAGFNVFYRYFRDKISWFEADAVCQFHHANLVTVENIEQFDAARQFLKELNIPDNVWIGLMRPSNTDQFSWTNSKPLPLSEGYWAEPWPISETPLCAVIDPTRDYRWHALRCGGPETAAFLCEMEIPDWALHCTENPDLTVQYISDSGAVQLSKACNDTIKEISCQSKASKMEMYDALKCPEEEVATIIPFSTTSSSSVSQESEPKVIIKNPQKMMEDILNSISVADVEVDSNRLDETEAQQKMDFDLMLGDQPTESDDKKTLLKLSDKKETFPKKSKKKSEQLKVKDDEQMQGDAPAEEIHSETNDEQDATLITTTDRQRRDANLIETTTANAELSSGSSTELPTETTNIEDLSSSISSTELPTTSEQITTAVFVEETTTKFIVQGHPLHMSQAIFKDPILPDVNNTHERIEIGESEDRFIPPMLLVKAKLTTTTTEGVKEDKETTIDISTSSTDQTLIDVTDIEEKSSESPIQLKEEPLSENATNDVQITTEIPSENAITTERPIAVGKRNDPRLGLKVTTTSIPMTTVTQQYSTIGSSPIVTMVDELISTTDSSSSSSIDESSTHESSSMFSITTEEIVETTSLPVDASDTPISETHTISELRKIDDATVEKLIALPIFTTRTEEKSSESVIKQTTPKTNVEITNNKSTTKMHNDINVYHQTEDTLSEKEESSREEHHKHKQDYHEDHHYDENKFSNSDDLELHKPNRHHRTINKSEHHHGPGFNIGKILG